MDNFLKVLNSESAVKAVEAIQQAISKLGDGAVYVADIVIRQQTVDAIQQLSFALLLIIPSIGFFKRAIKNNWGSDSDIGEWDTVTYGMLSVLATMAILIGFGCLMGAVGRFINPEYYAIEQVIYFIKNAQ